MPFDNALEYITCVGLSRLDAAVLSQTETCQAFPLAYLVENLEKVFQIEGIRELYSGLINREEDIPVAEIEASVRALIEKGHLVQHTRETLHFIASLYASPQLRPFAHVAEEIEVGDTEISWLGYQTVRYLRKFLEVHCIFGGCETRVLSDEKFLRYFSSDARLIRDELEYFSLDEEPVIEKCGPWVCNRWWDIRPAGYTCTIPIPKELKE